MSLPKRVVLRPKAAFSAQRIQPTEMALPFGSAFNRETHDATPARIQLPAKRCLVNHLSSQSD